MSVGYRVGYGGQAATQDHKYKYNDHESRRKAKLEQRKEHCETRSTGIMWPDLVTGDIGERMPFVPE